MTGVLGPWFLATLVLVLVGLDCLVVLVACLLLVGALPLDAFTPVRPLFFAPEPRVLVVPLALVAVLPLFFAPEPLVFLLLDGADLLVDVLLELDLVLELVRLDLFCLLLDRRPRRPPLLAIVFLSYTVVIPLNH